MTVPILDNKNTASESVFRPDKLIREARRQKNLPADPIPDVCVLDPDGDIVRYLKASGAAMLSASWPCYHSELYEFTLAGRRVGIVGCAVGAPFAVLIAEQAFSSGCRLLINVTSAGQIVSVAQPPYFIVIDRALRDEGTSYHYLPPSDFVAADAALAKAAAGALARSGERVLTGASWTTDAPFRETAEAIEHARSLGILAVEMEAAALYALAQAKAWPILCLAHVTNAMESTGADFEKGAASGAIEALAVLGAIIAAVGPPVDSGASA